MRNGGYFRLRRQTFMDGAEKRGRPVRPGKGNTATKVIRTRKQVMIWLHCLSAAKGNNKNES